MRLRRATMLVYLLLTFTWEHADQLDVPAPAFGTPGELAAKLRVRTALGRDAVRRLAGCGLNTSCCEPRNVKRAFKFPAAFGWGTSANWID